MKQYSIFTLVGLLILLSCNNPNDKSEQSDKQAGDTKFSNESVILHSETTSEAMGNGNTLDWTKIKLLKQDFLAELNSSADKDKAIVGFLEKYEKLENEFNDILFGLNNYDSLSTLAHSPDSFIYEKALQFEKEVENNGFSIAKSEGMIYLTKNTGYIKSGVYELLDTTSVAFLTGYSNEIDSKCCDDAAIIISEQELVERTYHWGQLFEKTKDKAYHSIAKSEFYTYLSLLYMGIDNTPSFDWNTKKFNPDYFNYMINVIEKAPKSIAAKEFKEYTELLVAENHEKTAKIDLFLKDKFE